MLRVAERIRYNSPEKIGQALDEALELLGERELEPALAAAVLPQLVVLLAAEHVQLEQVEVSRLGLLGGQG